MITLQTIKNIPTDQDEVRVPCYAQSPVQLPMPASKAVLYADKSIGATSYSTPVTFPSTNISVFAQSDTKEINDNRQTPVASTSITKDSVSK